MIRPLLYVALLLVVTGCDASTADTDDVGREQADADGATGAGDPADGAIGSDAADASVAQKDAGDASETRDARAWPFSVDSIWNTSIGSNAMFANATLASTAGTMSVDEDIIVMHPEAPLVSLQLTNAGWNNTLDRCTPTGGVFDSVPIPTSFVFRPILPDTPNAGLAALRPDGHTIAQNQPFSRCSAGGIATSGGNFYIPSGLGLTHDQDLFGPGTIGAHGGSGLSAIGGALRLGELRKGGPEVRHALKIELWKKTNFFTCTTSPTTTGSAQCNFVWPAITGETNGVGGTANTYVREGSLLALGPDFDTTKLQTEPARHIAWTLQNYGGYIVDDTAWATYSLVVEKGPDGSFQQQFETDYGFGMIAHSASADPNVTKWRADMETIFQALKVVINNQPATPGGGGVPRQPPAPAFK